MNSCPCGSGQQVTGTVTWGWDHITSISTLGVCYQTGHHRFNQAVCDSCSTMILEQEYDNPDRSDRPDDELRYTTPDRCTR